MCTQAGIDGFGLALPTAAPGSSPVTRHCGRSRRRQVKAVKPCGKITTGCLK